MRVNFEGGGVVVVGVRLLSWCVDGEHLADSREVEFCVAYGYAVIRICCADAGEDADGDEDEECNFIWFHVWKYTTCKVTLFL